MLEPPTTPPRGFLTTFVSRRQDPQWDAPRRRRAQPYQRRLDAWRQAYRAWKKSGPFGMGGGWSWAKPAPLPATPPELAPYVKGVGRGELAKRLPLPLRAAVALAKPYAAAAGRRAASIAMPRRVGLGGAALIVGLPLAAAYRDARKKNAEKRKAMFGTRQEIGLGKLTKRGDTNERDNRLVQPAQLVGGAFGGALGGYAGAKLGQRYADRPAARFGRRLGARLRLADLQAQRGMGFSRSYIARSTLAGNPQAASQIVRRQSHMLSRFGRMGAKGGIIGGAALAGSLIGDYAGDWGARRIQGIRGKADEYRNQGILGGIAGAGVGLMAQLAAGRARWARRLTQFRRHKLAIGAGVAGAMAGETLGNIGDAKYNTGQLILSQDRRLTRSAPAGRLAKLFDESKVNRDEDGKFAPKDGGRARLAAGAPRPRHVASIYSRGPAWEDREKPAYDPARSVRPTRDMPYGVRQAYSKYRAELDAKPPAPPATPAKGEGLPAAQPQQPPPHPGTGGRFLEVTMRPQRPSTMSEDDYVQFARWAADRTKTLRDEVIQRSIGRRDPGGHKHRVMLPLGTDPKAKEVRLAANLARNLALMDNGIIAYDYRMTPETIQALQPYKAFIKHARRRMANAIREEAPPGTLAPFRREFGKPFADRRTYKFDTRAGHKAGEEKRSFPRMMHFLKAVQNGGLAKARVLTEAERQQRIKAARASAAARSRARQQPTARSFEPPGREYAPIAERHMARDKAEEIFGHYMDLHRRRQAILRRDTVERGGVFGRTRPLTAAEQEEVSRLWAESQKVRRDAMKAHTELRLRQAASERGPRWMYVGLDPARWEPVENLRAVPPGRAFTGKPRALPGPGPGETVQRVVRAARWGRGAKIAGAAAGAAALAGAAYGGYRWGQRKAA